MDRIRVPPLAVVAVAAFVMWLGARFLPSVRADLPGRAAVAAALLLAALVVCVAGVVEFRRARTTVNPMNPGAASSLVTSGIYRFSRNPMYLGFAIALLAFAVYLAHAVGPVVLIGFVVYMNRFQVAPEERALQTIFADRFTEYAARVRRWI